MSTFEEGEEHILCDFLKKHMNALQKKAIRNKESLEEVLRSEIAILESSSYKRKSSTKYFRGPVEELLISFYKRVVWSGTNSVKEVIAELRTTLVNM